MAAQSSATIDLRKILGPGGTIDAAKLYALLSGYLPSPLIYDPGLNHTAICTSRITNAGPDGELRYRGYPVAELATANDFLEVAFLLYHGSLPGDRAREGWNQAVRDSGTSALDLLRLLEAVPNSISPHSRLLSAISFWRDLPAAAGERHRSPDERACEFLGLLPGLVGGCLHPSDSELIVQLADTEPYALAVLRTLYGSQVRAPPSVVLTSSLNALLIAHADHEQACSTHVLRAAQSAGGSLEMGLVAAAATLAGPLHGGGSVEVLRQFQAIGAPERIPEFLRSVKSDGLAVPGLGHCARPSGDLRSRIARSAAVAAAKETGKTDLLRVALALESAIESDEYFKARRLLPNLEFYSSVAFHALGLTADVFPLIFTIARAAGWVAHWSEMQLDGQQPMVRPRQLYDGPDSRSVSG